MTVEEPPTPGTGWPAFRYELIRFMELRDMSAADLAAELGSWVTAEKVRGWRRKSKAPPPSITDLPAIARVLRMNDHPEQSEDHDPTYLLRKMGLLEDLPAHLAIAKAQAVAKTEARLESLTQRIEGLEDGALGSLIMAVTAEPEWAIAVWPATERFTAAAPSGGERQFSIRTADRIDIRRTDGEPANPETIRRIFEPQMDAAGIVRTAPAPPRWARSEEVRSHTVTSWAVRRLGRRHSSAIEFPHHGMVFGATVTSLTVMSWANDVAAHLARLLGYGLESTRDLTQTAFGHSQLSDSGQERAEFQLNLVRTPRAKRIWSHWDWGSDVASTLVGHGLGAHGVQFVYLEEDDGCLRRAAVQAMQWHRRQNEDLGEAHPVPSEHAVLAQMQARREQVREALRDPNVSNVQVHNVDSGAGNETARRSAKLRQTCELAATTLDRWLDDGLVTRDALENHWDRTRDPHTTELVRYLREIHGERWSL